MHDPLFDQMDKALETLLNGAIDLPPEAERRLREIKRELQEIRDNIKH